MPIVPRPQNTSVMPQFGRAATFDNPLALTAATLAGRQMSEMGEAIQSSAPGVAEAADALARSARDKAETMVALEGSNRLQGMVANLSDPQTGYRSLLGADAVKGINGLALTDHYLSVFDNGWKDISSKLMPRPQAIFDLSAATMRKDFARDLIAHEAEQGRVWRSQVLNTAVSNATEAIVSGTGGNDAGHVAKARAALTADGLGQGLPGDALDANTGIAFGRRVVEPVVTARLSQGDVAGAKTFFDTHRDDMAADDADVLDKWLAEAGQAADRRAHVEDSWKRLGPKSLNDPIDVEAMQNDLVYRYGGDDKALTQARDELFHRMFGFTQARDEAHAGYVNAAVARIKGGASPAEIASLPQFLALPQDRQQQITNWQRDRLAEKLSGFASDQNLDRMARQFAAYYDLSGGDALRQMSDARVQALEPVLGEKLMTQALAEKQSPLDTTDFAVLTRSIGLDPAPSDVLGKARLGAVRRAAGKAIASAGKPLTPRQQREVGLGAAQTAIAGHPLFQVSPEVQRVLDATPADVLGPTTSALSPEPWSPPPGEELHPAWGPVRPPSVRPQQAPSQPAPSQPPPSEDPVIRQAAEKATRLGQIANGWSRAAGAAAQAAKSVGKFVVRKVPIVGTAAALLEPSEIGTEVSTYLFGRNAADTNLRLSGRSDDVTRVVQMRHRGVFGDTWEPIARTERDNHDGGSFRILDHAAFAQKTGLDWDTIILQSTGGKPENKIGFGIAVNNDEERHLLNEGIAGRKSATNIQRDIDSLRRSRDSSGKSGVTVSGSTGTKKHLSAADYGIPAHLNPRQSLHIPPVSDGRSVLTVDPDTLVQGLHHGAFKILRQPKPGQVIVDFGRPIGEYWQDGVRVGETRFGSVSYGKKGVHIIPANPKQW